MFATWGDKSKENEVTKGVYNQRRWLIQKINNNKEYNKVIKNK